MCEALRCRGLRAWSEFPDTKSLRPTVLPMGGGPGYQGARPRVPHGLGQRQAGAWT